MEITAAARRLATPRNATQRPFPEVVMVTCSCRIHAPLAVDWPAVLAEIESSRRNASRRNASRRNATQLLENVTGKPTVCIQDVDMPIQKNKRMENA